MKLKRSRLVGEYEIRFKFSVALTLFVLAIGITVIYGLFLDYRDIVKFGTTVLGGMAGLYAAFYVGKSLKIKVKRDALRQSLDLIHIQDTIELNKVRTLIDKELYLKEIAPSEMYKLISDDSRMNNAVITVLNQFETVALTIENGLADENMLYWSLSFRVPFYFDTLKPFVTQLRKELNCEDLFIETEKLANSWNAKKYLYSGEVVPQ